MYKTKDAFGSQHTLHRDINAAARLGWMTHNFEEMRGVGASKGVVLSTTLGITPFPTTSDGVVHFSLASRLYSTAVVSRYALTPYAVVLKTTDALAASANATDYSSQAQDGSTSTDITLSSLGTPAQSDFLFVGCPVPFAGASIDVDAANGTASVLTVKYWKSDLTWADITATDNTASGGASLAQDGTVTWTAPTDWQIASLDTAMGLSAGFGNTGKYLYWTRWEFSGGLDSSTTLNSLIAIARSTAYAEIGLSLEQTWFSAYKGLRYIPELQRYSGHSGIQAVTDAGTSALIITAATNPGAYFS